MPIQDAATGTLRRRYSAVRPAPESARNATRRTTRHLQDLVPQLAGHLDFSCKMLTLSMPLRIVESSVRTMRSALALALEATCKGQGHFIIHMSFWMSPPDYVRITIRVD